MVCLLFFETYISLNIALELQIKSINSELFSLLFQSAVYHVTRGHRVTFICDSATINKKLPLLNTNFEISENKDILKGIDMKYCESLIDLFGYFTHFHLYQDDKFPHVVIIYDIIQYLEVSLFCQDEDNHDNDMENDNDIENDFDQSQDYPVPSDTDDDDDDDYEDSNDNNNNNDGDDNKEEKEEEEDIDSSENEDDIEDFLDKNGELDYGIKLAQFLPILHETKRCVAKFLKNERNEVNKTKNKRLGFLDEMIVMIGMECTNNEFNQQSNSLYPFWRNWMFERFLKCNFDPITNIIKIQYDTNDNDENNNDNDEDEDDDIDMNINKISKEPPPVYCLVSQNHIDMIRHK